MKTMIAGVLALSLSQLSNAQSIDRPAIKAGDTWTYRDTIESAPSGWKQSRTDISVSRVTSSAIYLTARESGSSQPPRDLFVGADWSRIRSVNGKETMVNQPLNFPLSTGKTWTVKYREENPNKTHKFEEWNTRYTVVGPEKITVLGSAYDAIKIEAEGTWKAENMPATSVVQGVQNIAGSTSMATEVRNTGATPFEGRLYKALWFVPEIHRWVKLVEENYSAEGNRTQRITSELESFKLAE